MRSAVSGACAVAALGSAIAIASAPCAGATPDEAAFLAGLNQQGVPYQLNGGDQPALQHGYLICAGYTSGRLDDDRLANMLFDQSYTYPQKVSFVSVAKNTLCPS